jgi:glycosyltransferase involved in cell wall biosynthesis
VPALNEGANIAHVLERVPEEVFEVVLVDGRSTDDTIANAKAARPDVVIVPQEGRGKGDAITSGMRAARGEIFVMLDADGSARPEEIMRFVEVLVAGADFAKGSRFLPGGGSVDITRFRALGNRVLTGLVNLLFRSRYTDLCYGYNAFWRSAADGLYLDADGFEIETQMNLRAISGGLAVVEVPSFEDARLSGVSNLNAFRDGWKVLRTILHEFGRGGRGAQAPALPGPVEHAPVAAAVADSSYEPV